MRRLSLGLGVLALAMAVRWHGQVHSVAEGAPASSAGGSGLALVTLGDLVDGIESARTVTLSAYTLSPRGQVARTLVSAARRGAAVRLVLAGEGMPGAVRDNARAAAALCDASGGSAEERADGPLEAVCTGPMRIDLSRFELHMKAASVDGRLLYVSDRNWTASRRSLIVALPANARVTLERAILGQTGSSGELRTRKADALALEASLLSTRRSRQVFVETESFGRGVIAEAIAVRARAGDAVTLVVARSEYEQSDAERATIAALPPNVHVYIGESDEKIAVDGDAAWLGSANATRGVPDQVDWGYALENEQLAQTLADHVRSDAAAGTQVR